MTLIAALCGDEEIRSLIFTEKHGLREIEEMICNDIVVKV